MKPPPRETLPPTGAKPLELVLGYHRRLRLIVLLGALAIMLAASAAAMAETLGWWRDGSLTSLGLAGLAATVVVFWLRWISRIEAGELARALDKKWEMKSRLESALELAHDESVLAESLREDAGRRVAGKKPPLRWGWLLAVAFIGLVGLLLLSEVGIQVVRSRPATRPASVANPAGTAEAKIATATPSGNKKTAEENAASTGGAEIRWISPPPQSRATAIEDVALKAAVETSTGLRNLALEISVNGGTPTTRPLNADASAKAGRAVAREIEQTLHVDELGVKDYDVISYFLRGETIVAQPATIASTLQFIQIRPAHEQPAPGGGNASELAALLYRLQAAQMDIVQQTFGLARTAVAPLDDGWRRANRALATRQAELSDQTTELRRLARAEDAPELMAANLAKAAALMTAAAGRINAEADDAAVRLQMQALALLAECDRLFRRALKGPPPKTSGADPFREKKPLVLPERSTTPAGLLEALAQRQSQILSELSGATGSGGVGESEAAVAEEASRLASGAGLSEKSQQAVRRAADEAKTAAARMAAGDAKGALPPAMAAAQALDDAVREQAGVGRLEALAALEAARREVNTAARVGAQSSRSERITEVVAELERAAEEQQRTGLAEAARQLVAVANHFRPLESAAPASEAWSTCVRQAAAAQVIVATPRDAIRRAVRQIERGRLALAQAGEAPGRDDVELAAQIAGEVLVEPATQQVALKLAVAASARGNDATAAEMLGGQCETVGRELRKLLSDGERNERVRRFNPEEIDPAYRASVEEYFERLSREGTRP